MDWQVIGRNMEYMAGGLGLTVEIMLIGLFGGLLLGTVLGLGRLSSRRWLNVPATLYVNFFLSQPLILVIFWLYFLAPVFIGSPLGAFHSTAIAFVIFEAAYFAEIVRGGIQSVSRGQVLAAHACGLGYFQTQLHIVLPQAFKNMVPALTTRTVIIFQDTSLAYVVGLREFLRRVNLVDTREGRSIELYLFAGLVYWVLCSVGSYAAHLLENRRGGLLA